MSKLNPSTRSLAMAALGFSIAAFVAAMIGVANGASTRVIVHKGQIAPGAVTAKTLAKGAVHAKALAKNAVHARALAKKAVHSKNLGSETVNRRILRKEAVTSAGLARDAVTAAAIAPGSIHGYALGPETLQTKPIADLDKVAHNGEWTSSNTEAALCAPGEALLGPGLVFTEPGNAQVGWLQALPVLNGETRGVTGRITSDSGGTATAEIAALCLG
ncbi:MAG: hypothetical protein U0R71_00985 [Solirubrobacterales bacterium]